MKLTKRKGFNFLRSYFDVLNELKEDSDKLDFLMSIINKQFLDEDPKNLGFISNLCYESQRHSIEKSVKGWLLANKTDLKGNPTPPPTPPKGSPPTSPPKEEQEQEQEKEEVEYIYSLYPSTCVVKKSSTGKCKSNKEKIKKLLKEYSKDKLDFIIKKYIDDCKSHKVYMKNFGTFLNNLPDYEDTVDDNEIDENYIYYRWMNDPSIFARRIKKEEAEKEFKKQLVGGLTPVYLQSIKGKKHLWN
jgi:hypothetical protein